MKERFNPDAEVVCPFMSTAEKIILCRHDCALYARNDQCAFVNLGSVDFGNHVKNIELSLDGITDMISAAAQEKL